MYSFAVARLSLMSICRGLFLGSCQSTSGSRYPSDRKESNDQTRIGENQELSHAVSASAALLAHIPRIHEWV
jgi:hypothetical protein